MAFASSARIASEVMKVITEAKIVFHLVNLNGPL